MHNFRVIVSGNSGDGFSFRIEDVYTGGRPFYSQFVDHTDGLHSGSSIEDLKTKLREMLAACDEKPLYLTRPELREWI